jgi:hypothetical protein
MDGRNKEGHARKNLSEGQWEVRKQWSLGVGQRTKMFRNRYIHTYKYLKYVTMTTLVIIVFIDAFCNNYCYFYG